MKEHSVILTVALALALTAIGVLFALTSSDLSATREELSSTKLALAQATTQVGYRNPTYAELKQFIQNDQTDQNQYIEDVYDCHNFAADVNLNAEATGLRAAYVNIAFPDIGHAIVAFDTVDKGIVYIEPQHDDEVIVPISQSYSDSNGYQEPTDYDDTIVSVTVIW